LAVFDSATGYWYIRDMNGALVAWALPWGWPGAVPLSGDYTGDGADDLVVYGEAAGQWYVLSLAGGQAVASLGGAGLFAVRP